MDYSDHDEVMKCLKRDQQAEEDLRREIDDIIHFLHHPRGQWEPAIWNQFEGRPRYTFDQCKPAIAKVWAEMAANEYAASTQPVGGGATEDVSNLIDGLIRNIYNRSSFDDVSTKAGKRMIATGLGCWEIRAQYEPDCFYQELMLHLVNNCHRRVWFDCGAEKQTKEDAWHVHLFSNVSYAEAEEIVKKYDDRRPMSVTDNRSTDAYTYKPEDTCVLAKIFYKKKIEKTIYLINDGRVMDEKGLEANNLTTKDPSIIDSRETTGFRVYSRKYDAKGWIGEEAETVFSYLPIIPIFAHFDINEDGKSTYEGMVRPVMDNQRVFNYAESRKIEESVLGVRQKILVDDRITKGYAEEFSNLNRDPRAVQQFNGAEADKVKHGVPFFPTPGPQPNPAITEISNDMIRNFQLTLGLPNELQAMQSTVKDSDFRFDQRTSMGQVGTFEYYRSLKVGLEHTAKVLLDAIPRVYDTARKLRIIDESGQSTEVEVNTPSEEAEGKTLYDLTTGKYDICVNISENFETRQAKANSAIMEMGQIYPDIIPRNSDVIANNIKAPGMRMVADRERAWNFQNGFIPESQWTEEEKQKKIEAANQPPQPDPGTLIAQAELQKAQAETDQVQAKVLIEQAKLEQKQLEMQITQQKQQTDTTLQAIKLEMEQMRSEYQNLRDMAAAAKSLAEAGNTLEQRVVDKAESQI